MGTDERFKDLESGFYWVKRSCPDWRVLDGWQPALFFKTTKSWMLFGEEVACYGKSIIELGPRLEKENT